MKEYDYIICGSGPSSLTLATLLSRKYENILILEKSNHIGGQNGVERGPNNEFEEHSPRVQSSAYVNFKSILKDMGMEFENLFTYYALPSMNMIPFLTNLSIPTLFRFTIAFILFLFNENYGIDIPLEDIANGNASDVMFLERTCRIIDGGRVNNTRLNQILQVANQNMLYSFYQPKETTDTGLFKKWSKYLTSKGVEIKLNESVDTISNETVNNSYRYKNLILAIPPSALAKLIPSYKEYANKTKYSKYIAATLHWKDKLDIPNPDDYSKSGDLGLIAVVTSNYTSDPISPYKTVVSCAISNTENYHNNPDTIYKQLKNLIPNLKKPDKILVHHDDDGTYFDAVDTRPIPFQTPIKNVYTLGTQNGKSDYKFTSLESAVINAIYLGKYFGIKKKIEYPWNIRQIIFIILFVIIIYSLIK